MPAEHLIRRLCIGRSNLLGQLDRERLLNSRTPEKPEVVAAAAAVLRL